MTKQKKRVIIIIAAAVILAIAAVVFFVVKSNLKVGYRSISISDIFGKVTAQNSGKSYDAYKNMRLSDGYALITDLDSYTRMILDDDKYVKLEQNSHALFEALGDAKLHKTSIRLERGALTTEITKPLTESESYVVNTPNAVLAVRGTMFRVEVKQEENGDYYCDVYTYGGTIVAQRVMPDGTLVDEHVEIPAGYKATIKMDEVITVYLEEKIDEIKDDIDPIEMSKILDGDLVDVYNASKYGHTMYVDTIDFLKEIDRRGIDVSQYKSVYDDTPVGRIDDTDNVSSDVESVSSDYESGTADNSSENSEPVNIPDDSGNNGGDDKNNDDNDGNNNNESINESGNNGGNDESNSDNESNSGNDGTNDSSIQAHIHDIEELRTEPTCTEKGYVIKKCRICGEIISRETLQPQGHISDTKTVEPTCTKDGSETIKCKICGGILGNKTLPKLGHKEVTERTEPTCTEDGTEVTTCERCNEELERTPLAKLGHDTKTERTEPTCTEDGAEVTTCKRCRVELERTPLAKLGHDTKTERTEPTCTEDGAEVTTCKRCREELERIPLAKLGHDTKTERTEPTCTEDGAEVTTCERCNEELNREILPKLGHTETTETVKPTCTEKGKITVKCTVCGEIISETEIAPKGHIGKTTIIEATCTNDGSEETCCEICNALLGSKSIPATGHTEIEQKVEPTCTEKGKTTVTCSVCHEKLSETETDALGHDYVEEITKEATCTAEGEKHNICTRCDVEEPGSVEVIAKTAHTPGESETIDGVETVKCSVCGEILTQKLNGITYPVEISSAFTDTDFADEVRKNDADGDGKLSLDEARAVTSLDLTDVPVTSLSGIETLPELSALKYTVHIEDGELTLPAVEGISAADISNVKGGTYDDTTHNLTEITGGEGIGYTYNNRGKSVAVTLAADETSTFAAVGVAIDATNFPDAKFREYVTTNFDKDTNGYLSQKECNAVTTSIDVNGSSSADGGITSIKGVENFTKLAALYCYYNSSLTELDVSKNTALDRLNCSFTQITSLVLSNNTELRYLYCHWAPITSLDISDNAELLTLCVIATQITSLDVSKNTMLTDLMCHDTKITSLDVSKNTALEYLDCHNTHITSLDVNNNTALTRLKCNSTQVSALDVSKNTALTDLYCEYTQITSLDVSKNTALTTLYCYNTKIPFVDVSNCDKLTDFKANDCQHPIHVENGAFNLKSIEGFDITRIVDGSLTGAEMDENGVLSGITEGTNITYTYDCDGKGGHNATFTLVPDENSTFAPEGVTIDDTNFPDAKFREYVTTNFDTDKNGKLSQEESDKVTKIDVGGTYLADGGITSLKGLENFTKLKTLKCYYNSSLTELDVSNNTALTELDCHNMQITSLDVSNNTALKILGCGSTQITSLDVSNNTALTELYWADTPITSLDVSNNTALTRLSCCSTQITSLDVSKNTALTFLRCENTKISSLKVSKNTLLTYLDCSGTQITSLDVSKNTALEALYCYNTQIPFVDISNCPNLTNFSARGCKFYVSKNRTSIDAASDEDFTSIGFDFRNVYDVVGADYSRESGIFDNFTSDTVTYTYDCDGKRGHDVTFTMVRTDDESLLSTANATRSAPKKLALDPSIYAGAMLLTLRKLKNKNNT